MLETRPRTFTIARRRYDIAPATVIATMRGAQPEPVREHFVVVGDRRFPPKQVLSEVTGLDRADFTTHQARRILANLGFAAGRRPRAGEHPVRQEADADGRFAGLVGRWVALRDEEVLVSAEQPAEVVSWLARHRQHADTMFRVPEDAAAATGLAPQ